MSEQAKAVIQAVTLMGSLLLKNRTMDTTVMIMAMVLDSIIFPPIYFLQQVYETLCYFFSGVLLSV